jgi:hypothetical protein
MKETKLSPKLTEIIQKFKTRINLGDEEAFDRIIEFAYTEGSIDGQYELYHAEPPKT